MSNTIIIMNDRSLPDIVPNGEKSLKQLDTDKVQVDVYKFSETLEDYLYLLGLPHENVFVEVHERKKIVFNMGFVVEGLPEHLKQRACYISKFVASCSVGLFDAALSYLWNETIANLREKVVNLDLDYFYDNVIQDSQKRSKFKTADDIVNLSDDMLIEGCKKTGVISEIGYKFLVHIKDIRNSLSAAHPTNHTQISGLQLMGWLETCINEVLIKEPSPHLLSVKKLLGNIQRGVIDGKDAKLIIADIQKYPPNEVNSLLKGIFGMYTDPNKSQQVRNNIALLASDLWILCDETTKYEIGRKYGSFSVNGESDRKQLSKQFLEITDGLGYLTEDHTLIEIQDTLEALLAAHQGGNNFYTEEPHARTLLKYVPNNHSIPKSISYQYVRTLVICRLGNLYGVSYVSKPYYDEMITNFYDTEIKNFLKLTDDDYITAILRTEVRANRFRKIADCLHGKTENEVLKKALDKIIESSTNELNIRRTYINIKGLIESWEKHNA